MTANENGTHNALRCTRRPVVVHGLYYSGDGEAGSWEEVAR